MNDLRSILRKGDPAAGDPGLTAEEVRGMRRVVLSAVPEARRRGWLVPALATAACMILATVIALSLWRPEPSPPWPPSPSSPTPSQGEGGTAAQEGVRGRPSPGEGVLGRSGRGDGGEGSGSTKPVHPTPEPVVIARAETPPAPPVPEPPSVPAAQTQIQFSTPGGTRVIWLLNPATE
ncbi:MAG TPA: hypothetical protein VN493_22415 [Thermoanaerobaculia bacterium]|nr:hypothetical protein [Thermoanaerobaculia bacterium]